MNYLLESFLRYVPSHLKSCHLESRFGRRTSDSLNERLPIKMAREKFQRKRVFLIGQVPIKNMGWKLLFCYLTHKKLKKVLLKCFPPVTELILSHTVVVLHFTHHIKMA